MRFNCLQILFNISYIFILIFLWIKYISYNLVEFVYCSCSFLQIKYIQWFLSLIWVHVLFLRQGEGRYQKYDLCIKSDTMNCMYIFSLNIKNMEKWVYEMSTSLKYNPSFLSYYISSDLFLFNSTVPTPFNIQISSYFSILILTYYNKNIFVLKS